MSICVCHQYTSTIPAQLADKVQGPVETDLVSSAYLQKEKIVCLHSAEKILVSLNNVEPIIKAGSTNDIGSIHQTVLQLGFISYIPKG